jgi:hypothetical protein
MSLIAVFGRAELAAAAARTLPGHRHRAILAREGGDVERLRHRRIVDLALVEDFAGRVRGKFEQCADATQRRWSLSATISYLGARGLLELTGEGRWCASW